MKISGTCRSDDRHAVAAAKTARCIISVTGGRLLLYGHKSKRVVRASRTIRARTLPIAGDFRNCDQHLSLTAAQLPLWRTADWAPGARAEPRTVVPQTASARRYPSRRPSTTKLINERQKIKINPFTP